MKIYIAMIADRRTDTKAHPFSTAEKAIAHAKQAAIDSARRPGDVEEEQIDGWLYYARYSGEGDSVWVVETELDDAAPSTPDALDDSLGELGPATTKEA